MSTPSLRQSLYNQGLFVFKGKSLVQPTHYLLDGGKIDVKDMHAFYDAYTRAVLRQEHMYFVELKTSPVFKLFFDADVHTTDELDDTWCVKFAKYVMSAVTEMFSDSMDDSSQLMVLLRADMKNTKKNSVSCYKYGFHLVFPHIHVNTEMALRTRNAVLQKLSNNLPKSGPTTWEADIDEAVFGETGLRMPFSRKMVRCKCTLKNRDTCETCLGVGRYDEGRPYSPSFSMNGDLQISHIAFNDTPLHDDVLNLLVQTSIRSDRLEPSHKFNTMPPCWFEDPELSNITTFSKNKKRIRESLTEGHSAVESKLHHKQPLTPKDIENILAWMETKIRKKIICKEYKNTAMLSAFSFVNSGLRSNIICRLDSQFCMNIGREHTTNTVYMEINMNTRQCVFRCYCRCDTTEGRRRRDFRGNVVMCKDYKSDPIDTADLVLTCAASQNVPRQRVIANL